MSPAYRPTLLATNQREIQATLNHYAYGKFIMKTIIKQGFALLDKEAKKYFPILVLIFFSSSFLDVVGIGLVGAFLLLIINFDKMTHKLPFFFQHIFIHYSENEIVLIIGIGLVGIFIFKGYLALYSQRKMVFYISQFSLRFKIRLLKGYQNADNLFHMRENSAFLINRIALIDTFSNNVVSIALNVISSVFLILSVIFCLVLIHPMVTFLLSIMFVTIFFAYEFFVKNKLAELGRILGASGGEINKSVLHALNGLKEIRVLGREQFFLNKLQLVAQNYAQAFSLYSSLQLIPRYVVEAAASVFLVFLILGALSIGISPLSMIPTIGIFAAASIRLLPTVSQLIGQISQLRGSAYVTEVLYNEIDKVECQYKTNLQEQNTQKNKCFSQVSLQAVTFRYPDALSDALACATLNFFRGQSIGLIGSSGAGKSTLVNIILGLLSPRSGQVLVDGLPIKDLREWLNTFAYIPQSIFLLDDTIKHNIALGVEDNKIDHEKINRVIQQSQLIDVVANLPDGIDTKIGENGTRLSGGQRQRVALARALYYEREVIIMDEATSSLDNETENEVINSIKQLQGIKTLIIIAHRLTTIKHCDVIFKFEKGRIVSSGRFDEVVEYDKLMHIPKQQEV